MEADCSKNSELESNLHIAERTESGADSVIVQITEAVSVNVETTATTIGAKERELLEFANSILLSISNTQSDFTERHVDTRTKERPTMSDLKSINKVIKTLMSQSELSPEEDSFQYLWIAKCVLYSVIVAFLLSKGWKKTNPGHPNNSQKPAPKWKVVYEKNVMETRKKNLNCKGGNGENKGKSKAHEKRSKEQGLFRKGM